MFENYNIKSLELFKKAEQERELLHHEYVGTEHLMLALLKNNDALEKKLKKYNLNYNNFYEEVKMTLSPVRRPKKNHIYTPLLKKIINETMKDEVVDDTTFLFHILDEGEGVAIRILLSMGVDIDALYNSLKNGGIDKNLGIYKTGKLLNDYVDLNEKIVGREKEINLIIETLLRKKKNNPLLVGDAGVGKSAIVEELTRKIIKGEVTDKLLDAKIVMLEMSSLVSGTRYRGEFEEKLTNIINEVIEHKNIILFIDEIHTLSSAGAAEGAISAADILKPYLARGDIKCIGATTKEEYEKYIAKDKALSRRFEMILVEEPNEEETFNILKNIKNEYINFHQIKIKDDVLKSLIHLTKTYFPNKYNPDKSIELLDSVMSYVKLKNQNNNIKEKEYELKRIEMLKIQNVENGNFKAALSNNMLENKIKKDIENLKDSKQIYVTPEDIIDVLEFKNNIIINPKNICHINNKIERKVINIINKHLKKEGVKSFKMIGISDEIMTKIASDLGYHLFKITSDKSIDKMFKVVKYYPSTIILTNDDSFVINDMLKKIYKDQLIEYNDEYINFSNVILFVKEKNNSFGFNNQIVSDIPYDEIIKLNNSKIKNPV